MSRQPDLQKRFRKVAWGRLYFNYGRNQRLAHMDSDDVCIVRDGTLTTHYKTMKAFIEDLEAAEENDKLVAEMLKDQDGDGDSHGNSSHINVR